MKFVEVRHEEAGALAASAEYKLTGKLGSMFRFSWTWCCPLVQRFVRC